MCNPYSENLTLLLCWLRLVPLLREQKQVPLDVMVSHIFASADFFSQLLTSRSVQREPKLVSWIPSQVSFAALNVDGNVCGIPRCAGFVGYLRNRAGG